MNRIELYFCRPGFSGWGVSAARGCLLSLGEFKMIFYSVFAGERGSLLCCRHFTARLNSTRLFLSFLTLLFLLTSLPSAHAQVSASIKGVVTDPSGAPVPAAAVVTKSTETGATRSSITDDAGRYQIIYLA